MRNQRLKPAREKQPMAAASSPCGRLIRKLGRGRRGSLSVEFGLLAPLFVLLVLDIVDFGHALSRLRSATGDMKVE
jgi:Flp pilus assembly protein TadG